MRCCPRTLASRPFWFFAAAPVGQDATEPVTEDTAAETSVPKEDAVPEAADDVVNPIVEGEASAPAGECWEGEGEGEGVHPRGYLPAWFEKK